jgi:2-dehydro-3-deoxyphosphogluconate aldolase/(4S)-4-hydroxy-2-oxoglutarate aldolase
VNAGTVQQAVTEQRLIAIVRSDSAESAVRAGRSLLEAGVRCLEVSLVTPGAVDAIRALAADRPAGSHVGVGTVLSEAEAEAAAAAGATFVVSPTVDVAVIGRTKQLGLASFPGASTPTEACRAAGAGADAVKIFPASAWTPRVLRDVLTALPWLRTVPTGGVGYDDAADWIRAGAVAVGLGSTLTSADGTVAPERIRTLLRRLEAAGSPA